MYIHEAVKIALEIKGKITRPQEDTLTKRSVEI